MIEELNNEIQMPQNMADIMEQINLSQLPDISLSDNKKEGDNLFSDKSRKAWDKSVEARCDFQFHLRLTRRASTSFISIWQKSVFGWTLTEIKSDESMVSYFAEHLYPVIQEIIGYKLQHGDWAIVTTPMRRHKERNFASSIASQLAEILHIPFYFDCAHCRNRQRVNAVFDANNIPRERNVIVFDDFVTTGSTLLAMKNLLQAHNKNTIFFCGINNQM